MTGLYLRFHGWRGVSLTNIEPDLFHYVFRLGFVTVYVCRRCILDAYRKVKCAAQEALGRLNSEKDGEDIHR